MIHVIKMLLGGKKGQRSFKIISCEKKKISSKTQVNLGYLSANDDTYQFNIDWTKFWLLIKSGAKINKSLNKRLFNLNKKYNLSIEHKNNIEKILKKQII